MKYSHFTLLPERAFLKVGGKIMPQGGGSGGGGAPTQTNVTQTNIPEYARPYTESMLGATQQQLFNTQQVGATAGTPGVQTQTGTDTNGNPIYSITGGTEGTPGYTEITGIKPYQPYSANPSDYVAGFSPLQNQGFDDLANMKVAEQIAQGSDFANQASKGGMGTAAPAMAYGSQGVGIGQLGMQAGMAYGQNATNPNAIAAYMNPYLQASLAPQQQLLNQQFGIQNAANQSQATQQGAFGGGRQAIMQGLNQQNQNLATNQLISQGYNNAYNIANQNMQAASSLGMQGAGVGLQGVNAGLAGVQGAQNAYNIGLQGANTLGSLGTAQYNQQMGIAQARLAAGAQQQAQQQQIINQGVQNYATAQQYPQQQLAFMNSMLRGLPLQTSTTQQYQAAPSFTSQAAGLGIAGAGAYQLMKAEGGQIKEKKFAAGGIASGVPAGKLDAMLERLSDQQLAQKSQVPQNDPDTAAAAAGQQAFRQQMRNPGIGAAPAPSMNRFAGGGIVAFAGDGEEGSVVKDRFKPGASSVSLDQIVGAPSDQAIRAGVDRISGLAGNNMAGKGLLDFLGKRKAEAEGTADKQGAFRAIEAGLGIMGGTSPYAAVNIGQGGKEAIKGHMQDVKEQKAEEFAMAKAEFDVNNMSYQDRMNIVKMANEDEQKTKQILAQVYGSQMQAGATIEAARVSAKGHLDVEKERGINQLAVEKVKADAPSSAKTVADFIKNRTELNVANGMPAKDALDAATVTYLEKTHPNINELQGIAGFVGKEQDYIAALTSDAAERLKLARLRPEQKKEIADAEKAYTEQKQEAAKSYQKMVKHFQSLARPNSTTPPKTGTGETSGAKTFNWTGTGLEAANAN